MTSTGIRSSRQAEITISSDAAITRPVELTQRQVQELEPQLRPLVKAIGDGTEKITDALSRLSGYAMSLRWANDVEYLAGIGVSKAAIEAGLADVATLE